MNLLYNGVHYSLDATTHTASVISLPDDHYRGNIVIEPQVYYADELYPVVFIANGAFQQCTDLLSVCLPGSLGDIGMEAFCGCTGLTVVRIPGSVDYVGIGAFQNCTRLSTVIVEDGVQAIGVSAFMGCSALAHLELPDSIREIQMAAFSGCSSLRTLYMGAVHLTSLDRMAFDDNPSLRLYVPKNRKRMLCTADIDLPDTQIIEI